MLRRVFACVLILSTFAAAKDRIEKKTLKFEGRDRTYYVFAPPNLSAPAPLLLLLHGSAPGRNGRLMVNIWKDLANKEGIVLLGPDATRATAWNTRDDGPAFIHAVVEAVRAAYPIDGKRMYIFGHSGGAVFGLLLSLAEAEYFAATAVHAGAIPPQAYGWFNPGARRIPIKIFVGTDDAFFPLSAVRATRDFLQEKGFPVELTEIAAHTHNYYDVAPKINRDAWDFLKGHSVAEPRYLEP